jgi:predicted  nucleic acid-binding Zn ribbon protein
MKKNSHIHRYKRVNLARYGEFLVYKCTKPNCSHYMRTDLIEGKSAECPRCGDEFTFDLEHLKIVEPHCNNCKVNKEVSA